MSNQHPPRPASGGASPAQGASHPSAALAEGAIFAGRYRVVRCMAAGGMGSVYEVIHTETERRRALKVMHPHLFHSDEMRERFKREARIAAQVESEYIVDVSDAGVDEATKAPFLVMELLDGDELGNRLRRMGPLPPAEVVTYIHQVALALDKTHAKSIVHRDLKPENLFLTQREDGQPRVKILDFGVAKLVAETATGAGATRSLGTPLYMAPEQFRVGTKLMPAADIYALGMTAYTLLAGEPYWGPEARASGDVIAFAMAAIRGPVESAVRRAAVRGVTLPPGFDAWFTRVTAVNPADRFARASEAARALGAVFQGAPGASAPMPAAISHHAAGMPGAAPAAPHHANAVPGAPAPAMVPQGPGGMAPPMMTAAAAPMTMAAPGPDLGSSGITMAMPPGFVPGAGQTDGVLARASSSTGATVAPVMAPPASRSRGPLIAVAALLGAVALGAGVWFGIRGVSDGAPAAGAGASSSGAPLATMSPAATSRGETPSPTATSSGSASAAPTETPAASTAKTALTGRLPAAAPSVKPSASPSPKPGTKPTAAPTNLIGRD